MGKMGSLTQVFVLVSVCHQQLEELLEFLLCTLVPPFQYGSLVEKPIEAYEETHEALYGPTLHELSL